MAGKYKSAALTTLHYHPCPDGLHLVAVDAENFGIPVCVAAAEVRWLLDELAKEAELPDRWQLLRDWLDGEITDHEGLYAEYAEQGDDEQAGEQRAMSDALRGVQHHIEYEMGQGND